MAQNKVSAQFFRQPRYYSSFSCIGGSCPVSCCLIWRVDWTKDEVEKLKNAECSEHLRELINSSFEDIDDKYMIKMNGTRCPFLTDDNLCSIQRELGAEYLSYTCSVYPRHSVFDGHALYNYCNLSCYHIMDILCNDSECMKLENYRPRAKSSRTIHTSILANVSGHPETKYRHQLLEFFYEIISDDSHSVETSIILGALAAHSLSKLVSSGAYNKIPESLAAFKAQMKNPEQIKNIENIEPNYEVKFRFLNELNKKVLDSNLIEFISEDGLINIDKYNEGMKRFCDEFAEKPFAMRNIALNLLLELKMPFIIEDYNLFENYCYFAAAFAAIKLIAYSVYAVPKVSELGFKTTSAYVDRIFAHDTDTYTQLKNIQEILKELNFVSPAHLALIVK